MGQTLKITRKTAKKKQPTTTVAKKSMKPKRVKKVGKV